MIQSPPKYFFNNIQFNPSYYSTSSVSQIDLSKKINRGGDEMTGNLSLGNKYINNLATPLTALQAVNKTYCDSAIATSGGSFLPLSGGTMSGNIAFGGNNITAVNNVSAQGGSPLNLQIGTTNVLQLQPSQALLSLPISINLTALATGIAFNNTKIISCNSISGNLNTNLVLNYLNSASTILPKISLTATQTLITDGLKIGNNWIDMSGNAIVNIPNGVADGDGINKKQMDDADNLRLKLDGSTPMTGNVNCNGNNITNIGNLQSQIGSPLNLQIGTTNVLQLQPSQAVLSLPININLTALGTGIAFNNTKIMSCNSIAGNINTNLVLNYLNSASTILPKLTLTSGQTLITDGLKIGNNWIDMSGNAIVNIPNGVADGDGINKLQMDTADNLRLKLDGSTPMTGILNMNTYSINNVPILHAGTTISLRIATTTIMQIQATKVIMSKPISVSSTIGLGNVGIDMESTKITNVYSLTSYANNNLIFNYLSGINVLPKITLTSTKTQITDGLLINSGGIDMNSTLITSLGNGVFATDAVNKGQLDAVNNIKMNSLNGAGTGLMALTNTGVSLKLTNSVGSGNLILESVGNPIISFDNITTHTPIALMLVNTTSENLYFYHTSSYTPSLMLNSTSVNCYLPTKISGGLTMTTGGSSPIDMSGNNIANALITTPTIVAPIQTSTSSTYTTINNTNLNIGYTASNSYLIYTTMTAGNVYPLLGTTLGVNRGLSVASGVWIITAIYNPLCISGPSDSQRITMIVNTSSTSSATWTSFRASNYQQMLNGTYSAGDSGNAINTFVITLTSTTILYLWGIINYTTGGTAWAYDFAELKATRIA